MARGLNKVMLIGNLGKDPEVRYTQDGGQAVVNFSIATTMEWRDKATGEKREKTEWHRLVAFGKLGEICGQYLSKGKQVYIEGRLQTRSWEQDGVTRYTTEIVVSDMQMLGSARGADNSGYGNYQSEPAPAASANSNRGGGSPPQDNVQQPPADTFDDDIPF